MRLWMILTFTIWTSFATAQDFNYRNSTSISPSDYVLGSHGDRRSPIFDDYRQIEMGIDLGIGADCGRIDFKNTLRSTLKNVLDTKYLGDMGKDILAGSPLLLTCYFSPTWCAILKHSRIQANMVGQMRLNQCSLMDKYTDERVAEFYEERQECVRKENQKNGGDMEATMAKCGNRNMWSTATSNWAGSKNGQKADTNKLIDSSANWAGMTGKTAQKTIDLVKGLVGDTVIHKGSVSVEFGPEKVFTTPRHQLISAQKETYKKLCKDLISRLEDDSSTSIDLAVSDSDLKEISGDLDEPLIDRQTIWSLMSMPYRQREMACRKISDGIGITRFAIEMNRAMDTITVLAQNPNLPESRKRELDRKRKALKDSVELTMDLYKEKNAPLNNVLSQVNNMGAKYMNKATETSLESEANRANTSYIKSVYMDCADGIMCEGH